VTGYEKFHRQKFVLTSKGVRGGVCFLSPENLKRLATSE